MTSKRIQQEDTCRTVSMSIQWNLDRVSELMRTTFSSECIHLSNLELVFIIECTSLKVYYFYIKVLSPVIDNFIINCSINFFEPRSFNLRNIARKKCEFSSYCKKKCIIKLELDILREFLRGNAISILYELSSESKFTHEESTQTSPYICLGESTIGTLTKLSADFETLYNDKNGANFVLKVGNARFPAHRSVLSARSPIFKAMMQHKTSENITGEATIQDVDPIIMNAVLRYMYTGKIHDLNSNTVLAMFAVADKYDISELREESLLYLSNHITTENFYEAARLGYMYDEMRVACRIVDFFTSNMNDILSSKEWKDFAVENSMIAIKITSAACILLKKDLR